MVDVIRSAVPKNSRQLHLSVAMDRSVSGDSDERLALTALRGTLRVGRGRDKLAVICIGERTCP